MSAKENPESIASIVGGKQDLDGKLCIDDLNRVWKISQKHSGCSLNGDNVEACIPYWTCYFISLPGLKVIERDPGLGARKDDQPTLLEELLRLSVKNGDLLKDSRYRLLWVVKVSEYGLSLEGYDDNHWMPQKGLGVLSFGTLEKLSTEAQRQARKTEHRFENEALNNNQ